jgi:hypothetical protein
VHAAPRPAARVLLRGRFVVPRSSLLALPDGPVVGLDLTRGVPVTLELVPARDGNARTITASDLPADRSARAIADREPARRAPRRGGALRHELGSRRARITLVVGAGLACAVIAPGLAGGSRHPAREAARPQLVQAPAPTVAPPLPTRARGRAPLRVPSPAPASRGGPARVLVLAPLPPHLPRIERRTRRVRPERAAAPPTGWVDGLVVGS